MSGLYIQPFVPDSLGGDDDLDARAKHVLAELERNWEASVTELQELAKHWKLRFERYEELCIAAKRNRWRMNMNMLGELQGNVERFDVVAKQITDIEECLAQIGNILYPEPKIIIKKDPVKSTGVTRPRRRPAAGKGKK